MLAPLRLMHFRSLRGEIDDDDDDEWRGRRKESAVEGGRRDWRGQVSKARGVRSRGKREADLAAWMFLSFFVPLLPPPPEPSNYVVKREAIKTQEIEQQSHLRGCRFATVYWSTTATGGGGGRRVEKRGKSRPAGRAKREEKGMVEAWRSRTKRAPDVLLESKCRAPRRAAPGFFRPERPARTKSDVHVRLPAATRKSDRRLDIDHQNIIYTSRLDLTSFNRGID